MLVSHRKKFIYMKTHKTAGTSVEVYFEPWCWPEGQYVFQGLGTQQVVTEAGIVGTRGPRAAASEWYNHISAEEVARKVGADTWSEYFKFCVIRNPFDKLISAFYFKFAGWDWGIADPVVAFRAWVQAEINNASDRDIYTIDDKACLDYYIRFEELESGVQFVCDRIGVPFVPGQIRKSHSGFRKPDIPVHAYYDDPTTEVVMNAFSEEIAMFGYEAPAAESIA